MEAYNDGLWLETPAELQATARILRLLMKRQKFDPIARAATYATWEQVNTAWCKYHDQHTQQPVCFLESDQAQVALGALRMAAESDGDPLRAELAYTMLADYDEKLKMSTAEPSAADTAAESALTPSTQTPLQKITCIYSDLII